MSQPFSRRRFLKSSATGAVLLSGSPLDELFSGGRLAAAQAQVNPSLVQLRPEIAPLVNLIDRTPRERCVAMLLDQLRAGVPFRELLAAAFLYAIGRQGHHSVYLVHAAYQMSQDARPEDRLLPLFWGLDVMKEHIGRFQYGPVPPLGGTLPSAERAGVELDEAMQTWDSERAERAIIALSRSQGAQATMDRLWHYGARDWSFIGHLPIAVANACRTLQTIGWQHAEPVLRYVVRELHIRNTNKTEGQPYEVNRELIRKGFRKLPAGWAGASSDPAATQELLTVIRRGRWQPASTWVLERLIEGKIQAGTAWDAVHLAAAEFMVRFRLGGRRITNRALHSNTSANALHYAFRACADPETRCLILLQAVAWVTAFLENERGRQMLRNLTITAIPPAQTPASIPEATEAIFSALPRRGFQDEIEDRTGQDTACQMTFAFLQEPANVSPFLRNARQLLCRKATINSHDLKFPVAVFEDAHWVHARWRPHLLAASVHFLHGSRSEDNAAVREAREALRTP